ncbi:nucleotidyltransferase domain-containing protein [Candidatus Woesearchaeota archaeon]|nr:nucleotidyltransferase domain-containing protein [Candidatus Woesearchaeota archaeon]
MKPLKSSQIKLEKSQLLDINDPYRKVMHWFFAHPTREASLNEIVKQVKISKTTANRVISRLKKEEFLNIKTLGKIWRISCNQEHEFNTTKKIPYNLELIADSGIVKKILEVIPNSRSIILFGSYRKGDDIETSDLDIAVETLNNKEIEIINLGTIPELGYKKNVKVNILKFSRTKIDLNLFSNLANGIVLYGFFEARP